MNSKSKVDISNREYLEQLFSSYKEDPNSVHTDWKLFFDGVEFASQMDQGSFSKKELGVYNLINAYREDGHLQASLDPLQIQKPDTQTLNLKNFGLEQEDLDKKFDIFSILKQNSTSLSQVIAFLEKTYCAHLAIQVGACSPEIRQWFFEEFEQQKWSLSSEEKKYIFNKLIATEAFERFIHNRFLGAKRFSIEGSDALIPMLEYFAHLGSSNDVEELVIGMAHRGRLNTMVNFMEQPAAFVLSQFEEKLFNDMDFTGDVKYHIGYSSKKITMGGKECRLFLGFNPSHLESVNPIMCGVVRARQRKLKDTEERSKVIPILIHGDAAFCGQGVVSETLQLSLLEGYRVGGSVHIIINNQIGFTTSPEDARSSRYSSDLAKSIGAPILLVNGDDVEACVQAMDLAFRFRQKFKQDIVIDLISYRRFGHNEGDEPAFTQPIMYDVIKKHPTLMQVYKKQLKDEKVIDQDEQLFLKTYTDKLQENLEKIRENPIAIKEKELRGSYWSYFTKPSMEALEETVSTGAKKEQVDQVLNVLAAEPSAIGVNPKIKRLIQNRKKLQESGLLDWSMAEQLAYGTLLMEGHSVRVSGQDVIRGTFSHRHGSYFDPKTGEAYTPLAHLSKEQGEFNLYNSPLSEMAVLGFEYGNAIMDHNTLTIWEAQFGDFANGAQIIIDQYIASGEEKWFQTSSLTMFLPHGYEGQGPEHSSARLERFLQLYADHNIQVCYPTTPANLFHMLRRQVKRSFYKPLIVMTPKSMLRHPQMISNIEETTKGSFKEIIADEPENGKDIKTLVLCSGKIYFEWMEKKPDNMELALTIRLEQLSPFPRKALTPYINGFPKLKKVIWLQEEPRNQGAASFTLPLIQSLINELGLGDKVSVEYIGRSGMASASEGTSKAHKEKQNQLINEAFLKSKS